MANDDNLKPFVKGKDPRRQIGRVEGSKNRATLLRKWLEVPADYDNPATGQMEEGTLEDKVVVAQITRAASGDTNAFREVMDSVYGKIPQKTQLTGENDGPIQFDDLSKLSTDDLRARIALLRATVGRTGTGEA